jgi:Site-specific recombinase XerD
MSERIAVQDSIENYISSVRLSRSANTVRTYANAMNLFSQVLTGHELDPETMPIADLTEEPVIWVIRALKDMAPSTEQCYLTAVVGFYEFLAGENLAAINLPRIRLLIKQRARKPGIRLPQFPKSAIETVLDYAAGLHLFETKDPTQHLINMRDRAFLLTLADTGLRVHEACNLRRGDIDWDEYRAVIIGKGNREAVLRFSRRSLQALKDYLRLRAELDGGSGKALAALPIFARHDKGSGKKGQTHFHYHRAANCEPARQGSRRTRSGRLNYPAFFPPLFCHNRPARLWQPEAGTRACPPPKYCGHAALQPFERR